MYREKRQEAIGNTIAPDVLSMLLTIVL
jgi:hypothetical protein